MHRRAADAELLGDLRGTDAGSAQLLHLVSFRSRGWRSALVLAISLIGTGLGTSTSAMREPVFPIPSDEQHEGDFGEFLHLGIDRAERVGIEVEDA